MPRLPKREWTQRVVFCALCGEAHHIVEVFLNGLTCRDCGSGRFVTERPMIFSIQDRKFLRALDISAE